MPNLSVPVWIGLCLIALVVCLILILFIRTLFSRPPKQSPKRQKVLRLASSDQQIAVNRLMRLLSFQTVSHTDSEKTDWSAFESFIYELDTLFPILTQYCPRNFIGKTGMVYTYQGKQQDQPIVFMAHYDVVEADQGWNTNPFEPVLKDGKIYARGAIDDKASFCALLEAVELLIRSEYVPEQTIYLAFSGEEETAGNTCGEIVDWFEAKGIHPQTVYDEGGAVLDQILPGVDHPCAMIGVCEKGQSELKLSCEYPGGHASSPGNQTSVTELCSVIDKLNQPLPGKTLPIVRDLFRRLAPYASFKYRFIYTNFSFFEPFIVRRSAKQGGSFSALFRSTLAVTMLEGSGAVNVLPQTSVAYADLRVLQTQTEEEILSYLTKKAKNPSLQIEAIATRNPTAVSSTDSIGYVKLSDTIEDSFSDVLCIPYMMTARTDSRHYERICQNIYRFTPIAYEKGQVETMHAANEYICCDQLYLMISFYFRLMHQYFRSK